MLRSRTWKESSDLVYEIDQGEKAGTFFWIFSSFPRKIPFIKFFPIITTQYLCLVLNIKDKVGLFYEESALFWGRLVQFTKPMLPFLFLCMDLDLFPRFKGATKIFRLAHNSNRTVTEIQISWNICIFGKNIWACIQYWKPLIRTQKTSKCTPAKAEESFLLFVSLNISVD